MKRGSLLFLSLILVFLVLSGTAFGQQRQATTNVQSVVIEDFDNPEESRWQVTGSKFIAEGLPRVGWVRTWPDALYRREPEGRELRSMGIEAAFDRRGYNFLEITPVAEDEEGNIVPDGIEIPGRVQNMDMWVWGSNHDYYVEVQLRDYRGIVHTIDLGDINYRGWRNLRVGIPNHIPQGVRYVPQYQGLELVKIVLWTRPAEKVDGFFVYFDEIKVTTDVFEDPFDGETLADPDLVEELWSDAETTDVND
ncbi:MAG: flagellar filament outer layer protein FlaA [Spirochaetaceae bacterium]